MEVYKEPLHEVVPLLKKRNWIHARTNCPCKGNEYHSCYRKGDVVMVVFWKIEKVNITESATHSIAYELADLERILKEDIPALLV